MNEAMALLREVMERLGMTAEEAWPLVVAHVRMKAFSTVLVAVVGLGLIGAVMYALARHYKLSCKDGDSDAAGAALAFGGAIAAGAIAGCLALISVALPDLLASEGATVRMLIGR